MITTIIIISVSLIISTPILYSTLKGIKLGFDYARKDLDLEKKEPKIMKNYCKDCEHQYVTACKTDRYCEVYNGRVIYNGLNNNFNCPYFKNLKRI